jgi:hypothetical protein
MLEFLKHILRNQRETGFDVKTFAKTLLAWSALAGGNEFLVGNLFRDPLFWRDLNVCFEGEKRKFYALLIDCLDVLELQKFVSRVVVGLEILVNELEVLEVSPPVLGAVSSSVDTDNSTGPNGCTILAGSCLQFPIGHESIVSPLRNLQGLILGMIHGELALCFFELFPLHTNSWVSSVPVLLLCGIPKELERTVRNLNLLISFD